MDNSEKFSLYTEEFIRKLTPYVEFKLSPAGQVYPFVTNGRLNCYLIRTGSISVYYSGGILIGGRPAPFIFGLGEFDTASSLYFSTNEPCEIAESSRDAIFDIIEKDNLWQNLSVHMRFVSNMLLNYATILHAPSAYEIIRMQLLKLINEPESLRESITAEKYIRSKTHLSRSGIMRILSALKLGEYIVIEEGVLKEVRHLPTKY
ncbi:winged helix-turn-helix transcriptional regulator [Buttiauxella izardii]|uniref:Helix-turn-helix domain-containing protein n=1 Tax=Buttiauxella izardii TaxID=82991 RepID=A0A3A5K5G1_9ENTR|nr:winged helix-turn-helix transcriptional regulator [Buttiauxella izardii]RJT27982.1 helix-turn-helix domain-containing protein [Buttiauxella izardii]